MSVICENRVICKNGAVNVEKINIDRKKRRYTKDLFTTLIDAKWRFTFCFFAFNLLFSWTLFACFWYLLALLSGDIDYYAQMRSSSDSEQYGIDHPHTPCVRELYSFTSAFLFSIETQHTIGFGFRHPTECAGSAILLTIQSVVGMFIAAFMTGMVIAKLTRPKRRAQNLIFSKKAVIFQRNGIPCFAFRIADTRRSHIIDAKVRALLIKKEVSSEGESLPFYQQELSLAADGCDGRLMFIWPTLLTHKIDEKSPLFGVTKMDENFEIVVMLEGAVESTGLATQARSSYLSSEIIWNHRFEEMMKQSKESGKIEVDYSIFNNIYPCTNALTLPVVVDIGDESGRKLNGLRTPHQNGYLKSR